MAPSMPPGQSLRLAMAFAGSSELFLVDVVQVSERDAEAYLRALDEDGVPVMTAAGAALESCRSTHAGLGTDVDIEVVWRFQTSLIGT